MACEIDIANTVAKAQLESKFGVAGTIALQCMAEEEAVIIANAGMKGKCDELFAEKYGKD